MAWLAALFAFYCWTGTSSSSAPPDESEDTASGSHYYQLLAKGFLAGHLYMPVPVSPQLLALPDPYDATRNAAFRVQDASLYRGRYFLYFGPTPVVTLFVPWKAVTGRALSAVFQEFFFTPLNLTHTHLGAQPAPAAKPADVFDGMSDITEARASGAYWADGGMVSTAGEMNLFLKALNEGRIIRPESLRSMHDWHPWRFPLRYGLGTMSFELPGLVARSSGLRALWGHSGSTGSFLYRSDELDLYMAGTLDQTEARVDAFLLLRRVMQAFEATQRHQEATRQHGPG